jgi:hypothetical protein
MREFGVRRPLGDNGGQLLRDVLDEGVRIDGLVTISGIALEFGLSRVAGGMMVGIVLNCPWTYVWVAGLQAGVGLAACLIPALRAARVDPVTALRGD